ncbi:MAG: FimV/HubP family polar landmark protein [Litorilituus sp.]|nr:FimV/HubP family polar landmark protein [Litorilituus sp.]
MQKILCLCLWQVIVLSIATVSIFSISLPAVGQGVAAKEESGIRMRGPKSSDVFPYDKYGPITKRDTLWKIALTVRPDNRLTVYQVMQALYKANPQAFAENNLNYLVQGQYLQIPSFTQMMKINRTEAERKSNQDDQNWQKKQPKATNKTVNKLQEPSVNKKDLNTVKVEINDQLQKIDTEQQQRLKSIQNDVLDSIDGLQAILKENEKLRQRLASFNSQLGTMQKEVAKGKEIKLQMDHMLKLQQALLNKAQAREQELLLEKQRAEAAKNNIYSSLWLKVLIGTLPALLLLIVTVLIFKRKQSVQPAEEVVSQQDNKVHKEAIVAHKEEKEPVDAIDDLTLDDDSSLDGDLSLDDELEAEDDLSMDLVEEEDDVIHLDSDDEDELDGLDDLEDILLDDDSPLDEQSSEGIAQDDLDELLSSDELSIDESSLQEEALENNQIDQDDLDDLLNSLDEELSVDEDPLAEESHISIDDVIESDEPDELIEEVTADLDSVTDDETAQAEITDPDDIDALLESMNIEDSSENEESPVENQISQDSDEAEINSPDDLDALLDSMGVEDSSENEEPPVENQISQDSDEAEIEITDPDDIDALLDSMGSDEPQKEITDPDDIDAVLNSMGSDEPQKEITDPNDIDEILESMGEEENNDIVDNIGESPNRSKIESLSEEYIAPLLAADFSAIHKESSTDDMSSDIDANIVAPDESDQAENSDTLDIGDELDEGEQGAFDEEALSKLLHDSASENAVELTPDFSDKNVLADLLNDSSDDADNVTSEATEIDDIQELDNLEFDELLANIEEESNVASTSVDYTQDYDPDDSISLDDFDDPNSGVVTESDTKANEDNFVSVDSILSAAQDIDVTEELYDEANIDVGLNEYSEFTENVNQVDVDEDENGMAAKLDLAKVYVEIGDQDNAQVILLEIINHGNPQQQLEAQELLDNL